ncbi:hypothetical protein BV20DRAFT_235099 [Pilatotrama ljubarskyi]|nr:hypothetical protein BV20DRAFT_235099 [Pilatotrama ljubarskyi]
MRSSPRAGSRHLYRYSASPFSASSTNLAAHLNNSPVRSHRDFLRAPSSSSRGTASRAAISPPPSSAERSGNRSSSAGRGRKRSRDAGEDNSPDSEGMPSALQSSSRRPKRRRPLFIPRPFCTRETCLGRNLHLLEDSSSSRPGVSDSEDTWSTTAQPPSDSERDPVPELDHLEYRRRLFRKRKRAEGKGYGEGGPSSKRRKGGER